MALGALLTAAAFISALAFVTVLKVRHAAAVFAWVAGGMDRSTRRLAMLALVPAGVVTVWLSLEGLDPPSALVFGMALGFGVFVASLGIIGMERALLETESEALVRKELHGTLPTSTASRLSAISVGLGIVIAVVVALGWTVD